MLVELLYSRSLTWLGSDAEGMDDRATQRALLPRIKRQSSSRQITTLNEIEHCTDQDFDPKVCKRSNDLHGSADRL